MAQRVHDAVPVVLRGRLVVRGPTPSSRPDDSGRPRARRPCVAPAEVEPDAAAVMVPAERRRGGARRRQDPSPRPPRSGDRRRGPRRRSSRSDPWGYVAEVSAQRLDQRDGRVEMNAETAVRPQGESDQPFEHPEVGGGDRVVLRSRSVAKRETPPSVCSGANRTWTGRPVSRALERAPGHRRAEQRVEHGRQRSG